MVLVGNHFGTRVIGNHFLGGANSIRFLACPTETPVVWGWSHAPFLGAVIEDNILEDAAGGAVLGVEHSARYIKSNKGRTYMTIALNRNVASPRPDPGLPALARPRGVRCPSRRQPSRGACRGESTREPADPRGEI